MKVAIVHSISLILTSGGICQCLEREDEGSNKIYERRDSGLAGLIYELSICLTTGVKDLKEKPAAALCDVGHKARGYKVLCWL